MSVEISPNAHLWRDLLTYVQPRVDKQCQIREVCTHDTEHLGHVEHNAHFMREVVSQRLGLEVLSPSAIQVIVQPHDCGYGLNGIEWSGKEAVNHAQYGARFIERWGGMVRQKAPNQLLFAQEVALAQTAIAASTQDCLRVLCSTDDLTTLSSSDWASLILKFADLGDRYRRGRVEHIPAPHSVLGNPYHVLADAVSRYHFAYDQDTIQYLVHLNGDTGMDVATWHYEAEQENPDGWQFLHTFADKLGLRLLVRESMI